MDVKDILRRCDHTLLSQGATWAEIRALCDDGVKYGCASVCIPASYVKQAAEYLGGRLPVCTVIGVPNGYDTTAAKCFEAEDAVKNGADEIDMVINIGWARDGRWEDLLAEIRAVKAACGGRILKVILECCLLTEAEKRRTVMIGDRRFDAEGAAECGLPCVGVEFFGYAEPGELAAAGAIAVVRTAEELDAALRRL